MRVLVVGQGAREHAIAWKLRQSPLVKEVYAAPGNAGMAEVADCVNIGVADIIELADFAEKLKMDLTIVGPELPLTLGIVDEFQKRSLPIFGPTRLAAELEGSKAFSKEFMRKYGIPTAEARVCSSQDEAKAALKDFGYPVVIKVDGLASGKGVVIVNSKAEGEEYLRLVFEEKKFGNAANRILVEEFLTGEEVSFMALTDGTKFVSLAPAKDYKKAFDGETGPNTGGMGAHSPAVVLSGEAAAVIVKSIIMPTIQGMAEEGRPYTGCLYAGVMLTAKGPKVLEYNCRFGDPETQPVLMRLQTDLCDLLEAVVDDRLGDFAEDQLQWDPRPAVCVVIASGGYPGNYAKGKVIRGLDEAGKLADVKVFHAGTKFDGGAVVTDGGRVLGVTALGDTLADARSRAYDGAGRISWPGMQYRRDIAKAAASANADPNPADTRSAP